ncbi:MAG TPA: 7-carboxy-7-deazaguanine synthase QueE [candidate division Zixibacteria bacterium]|nr:7-carboxy-7-deazaguanine synthase QueE [candidate division Zixibacteria bacterium]
MKISEIFYSIQGEGALVGMPSVFIRTSGCNLRCRWCDTPYTSWSPEGDEMTVENILGVVEDYAATHVVITGGEPMLMKEMPDLTRRLTDCGYHITIETAATVYQQVACDLASLSPKLSNSTPWKEEGGKYAKKHERLRLNVEVLNTFMKTYPYQMKFVVDTPEDLDEVEGLLTRLEGIDRTHVLLMPQGRTAGELNEKARWIAKLCKTNGFRFCPRVHIDLYGDTRGT